MENNYLFIMFQGSETNIKSWNEYTESKFLDFYLISPQQNYKYFLLT